MLHFAYGSNMHRALMRKHAPGALALGVARLLDYRFAITADGYASVEPARAQCVYGVLWRLSPRDRVTLDAWENVASGLYRSATLAVHAGTGRRPALVYLARERPHGRPRPGYMELVIAAAEAWRLPVTYIAGLRRWLPMRLAGAGHRKLGEFI